MATITDEIKESFRRGTALVKLIYINLAVFLLVKILFVFFFLFVSTSDVQFKAVYFQATYLKYFMLPADLTELLHRPWSLLTYMFLHWNFLHILFNLLALFWFGRIFLRYLAERQLYTTYLLGGLSGAALYLISYNVFPGLDAHNAQVLGASASVVAILLAISAYAPNYTVYLPLIGPVKIKYIAIVIVVLDFVRVASENAGGFIAHIGGAAYGYIFALQLKKGKDIGSVFDRMMASLGGMFKKKPRMKVSYRSQAKKMDDMQYNKAKAENQKEIDRILDKIAKSGYDSLSKREKETLFKMSNKS
ncbi:MAG: rhomboid family intramembrane serine protease [Bacteroidales bacterium]|jgi:membrane associated rhomboid family serine protease